MIRFIRAHGADPGPTQRPLLAGALSGLAALVPAAAVFVAFGSFAVAADEVMRLAKPVTAGLLAVAFTLAGIVYGAVFRRAANDPGAGWLLGLSYGFLLWVAAPIVVLPLIRGPAMAAGLAATGFLATFLLWGLITGVLFPFVHRPLHAGLRSDGRTRHLGPDAATLKRRLLKRPA
jgi:hypothetical protein